VSGKPGERRPISWRPTERTPEGWVNVYGASADPFGEGVTFVLDVDGEREVEAARARGDEQVTLTRGAFVGVTFRTDMETGSRLYGDGRTERHGQRTPFPGHPRSIPRPWNRPAWATAMVVDRLRLVAPCPPFALSAAAIDAARDVLAFDLGKGDRLAGDEHADRLARSVQATLNRFVVERVHYHNPHHNPRPIPSRRFATEPLELHQAERLRRAFAGRVGMVAMGSWMMIGRVARLIVLPPEPIEWDLWSMISDIEHGWATSIVGWDGDLGVNDFDLGLHFGGPSGMPRWLTAAEVDVLDELAMVDSAHGRVPWLSSRLADYLRDGFGTVGADLAEAWLKQEAERERERSEQVSAPNAPAFALPGWADPWLTYVTPPAFAALALAVWRAELRPEVELVAKARAHTHTAAMLLPFVEATERPPGVAGLTPSASWNAAVVDAELAHRMIEAGDLAGSAGQAVMRSLPGLALEAHVHHGRGVEVFNEDGMQVQVQRTALGLTEVRCIGGYQALGRYLGTDREAVANAVRALASIGIDWHRTMTDGRTTLVLDLVDDRTGGAGRGVVSFAVPRVLSPSFAGELKGRDGTREIRTIVPVDPVMPPAPNPRTTAAASRLEQAAVRWLVEHPAECNADGGAVPWVALADSVRVSTAKQTARRAAVVDGLLDLWTSSGRWVRTESRWRPVYGWTLVLEGFGKREDGRKRQAAGQRRPKRGRKKA
jgi:hypothetical protein